MLLYRKVSTLILVRVSDKLDGNCLMMSVQKKLVVCCLMYIYMYNLTDDEASTSLTMPDTAERKNARK